MLLSYLQIDTDPNTCGDFKTQQFLESDHFIEAVAHSESDFVSSVAINQDPFIFKALLEVL